MKIKLLMLYDGAVAQVGDLARRAAEDYCRRHGYAFSCLRELVDPSLHVAWNRYRALRAGELESADWVLWLDADALIVDPSQRLEPIIERHCAGKPIAFSTDFNGLCSGVFLIKNCEWSLRLLDAALFLGQMRPEIGARYDQKPRRDQNTFKCLIEHFPAVGDKVAYLPEALVANPRTPFSRKTFVMHFWANAESERMSLIAAAMRRCLEQGWSEACRPRHPSPKPPRRSLLSRLWEALR